MANFESSVAEMQGLYGPFTMHERVVQKIWLQQDFASGSAALLDGRPLGFVKPGRWNLLGGPDFKHAQLTFNGREVHGDVEVHFHAADWTAHRHAENPAYADVVLHVLLFPPAPDSRPQRRADGAEIPALVLLPLLHRDLEEYAADDALEVLTARDDWRRLGELANLSPDTVRVQLHELAGKRWSAKVATARLRLARLGWEAAAHHTALEILGYRHNRVPMLATAERWPLAAWREKGRAAEAATEVHGWHRHGVRPANYPAARLRQYEQWVERAPHWTQRLADWAHEGRSQTPAASLSDATARTRRVGGFRAVRDLLWGEVVGRAVTGPRFETLVCDGFLPLAAAAYGRDAEWFALWYHWFPGDLPDAIRRGLAQLEVTDREHPLCHGVAQGLLAWLLEREFHA